MGQSSSRRWSRTLPTARRAGPESRSKRRRQLLGFEALEERVTLSLTPQMVLDINTTTLSSNPAQMVAIGSITYFSADDGVNGAELWKSDGTAAGTALVKDINPSGSSLPLDALHYLTNVNGTLFFTADDGTHGPELWKSDGTAAGTVLVKDIFPPGANSGPSKLVGVNGTLFFSAYNDTTGWELWKSDGTAAGTTLVKDIKPGYTGSYPSDLTNVNGKLFFASHDYFGTYAELWKSDGTAAGTLLVKSFNPEPNVNDAPSNLTNVNGTLFFSAYTVANGVELWKSDGTTAGTALVKDIITGSTGFYPSSLTNVNGTLFFTTVTGTGLWKSDGTAAGTTLVKDVYDPSQLTNANGTLFFSVNSGQLWKSDGTTAGTFTVKDFNAGDVAYSSSLTNVNGILFFAVSYRATAGAELWKSAGTAAGTVLVKDNDGGFMLNPPISFANVNGTLMFAAGDRQHGTELWRSNGTNAGTSLVKDVNTNTFGSNPYNQIDVNGTSFFTADDGVHGVELWKSDGTVAGATLLKDIYPGGVTGYYGYVANSSSPGNLTNVNGTLFFAANDGTGGWKLWKSDGTAAGTVLVSSLPWYPSNMTVVNETLFFTANGTNGNELWKSDGTVAGTTLVKDIYPGGSTGYYGYAVNSSSPGNLTNVNGTLFFAANAGTSGRELWKSDGTAAGTVQVKDVSPGTASSYSYLGTLTNVNGTLFFAANDGTTGYELWKSDGTAAGTVLVKDISPGSFWSVPNSLMNVDGTLFFSAHTATTGYELWKSDGTAAGTVLVKDIRPGNGDSYPGDDWFANGTKAVVDGTLFFTANDGTRGRELWKSDGTTAGTVLVKDITPGLGNNYDGPSSLTEVNGTLFFLAYDGSGTSKLWMSDGTEAGTEPIVNQSCRALTNVNGTLYFTMDDGIHGQELWKLVENGLPSLTIGDATVMEGHSGTRSATFTVTLSAASTLPVTVNYATANGTATVGSDYRSAAGTLTFAPGQTSKTITVLVNGDRLGEPNETYFVNLSSPGNATVADGQGAGTIVDDEPRISISDVTRVEGNSGTTSFVFTVTLSAAYDVPVTVNFATANGTANTGNNDYVGTSGTLTFAPGQRTKTVTVLVKGDTKKESNESFFVNLSGAPNALILDSQGVGTILNDDGGALASLNGGALASLNHPKGGRMLTRGRRA